MALQSESTDCTKTEAIERRELGIDEIESEGRVLYRDDSYVIIDKPCDVRMDGDHDVTVDKLVRKWIPELVNSELKWCHQLDYATSGVLCIALDKESACNACGLFAKKKAIKTYSALVYGDIDVESFKQVDKCDEPCFNDSLKRKKTKVQFKPAYSFFDQHQAQVRNKKRLKINDTCASDENSRAAATEGNDMFEHIEMSEQDILSMKWKDVKGNKMLFDQYKKMANNHENMETKKHQSATHDRWNQSLTVYRIKGEPQNVFYVQCPIESVPDEFHMKVAASGKPCLTRVEIIKRGAHPRPTSQLKSSATEVKLYPKTGRRHQLRVHMAHIGHPIIGDCTYAKGVGTGEYEIASTQEPRMMLHAAELILPFLCRDPIRAAVNPPFTVSF